MKERKSKNEKNTVYINIALASFVMRSICVCRNKL